MFMFINIYEMDIVLCSLIPDQICCLTFLYFCYLNFYHVIFNVPFFVLFWNTPLALPAMILFYFLLQAHPYFSQVRDAESSRMRT